MEKQKLLISFSGGRTSAFMTKWLFDHKRDEYDMKVVFANTGKEREETLSFIKCFESNFQIPVTWIEAVPQSGRKGTKCEVVDFYEASRNGEPFEAVIKKYGIPNHKKPVCTRELKRNAIRYYAKFCGWKKYYTAIGIRADEIDRIAKDHKKEMLIYPLIHLGITKPDVLSYWEKQGFDLRLEEHQGNCDCCFKKSFKKLTKLKNENPEMFDWWILMEAKYGKYASSGQKGLLDKISRGETLKFYRGNTSAIDIINGKLPKALKKVKNSCSESCEPFNK